MFNLIDFQSMFDLTAEKKLNILKRFETFRLVDQSDLTCIQVQPYSGIHHVVRIIFISEYIR